MENARMRNLITLILFLSASAFAGVAPVLMNQYTTNAAGATLGAILATNIVAVGSGTNEFDNSIFGNGLVAPTSTISTNTAAINTSSNPTNSYAVQTLYTNAGQRCLLIGSVAVPALTVANPAGLSIRYTNNAVGYVLQVGIAHANGSVGTTYIPFSIPMSVGATFKFETNSVNSAGVTVTNVVCWRL